MELTHRFRVPTPVAETWEAFSHLERLAPCFPGAVATSTGADTFRGSVSLKIGPVPLTYTGTGSYRERSAARHRLVVQAHGEDERGLGGAEVRWTVHLSARGRETEVELSTDFDLSGRPTQYGDPLVAQAADKLLDQFAAALAARLAAGPLEPVQGPAEETDRPDTSPGAKITNGSVGAAVPAEVAAPALDPGAPAGTAVVPPRVAGSGRAALVGDRVERSSRSGAVSPRRAQLPVPRTTAVRRYLPAAVVVAGVAAVAVGLLRRR